MSKASRLFTAGLFSACLVVSVASAADQASGGMTSGSAAGTNAAPNGSAQKAAAGMSKDGSDPQTLGLSAGAIGAGAPGVAGKPGGESDVGHTSAPGTPNPHQ